MGLRVSLPTPSQREQPARAFHSGPVKRAASSFYNYCYFGFLKKNAPSLIYNFMLKHIWH
jgi:hypothetical protein